MRSLRRFTSTGLGHLAGLRDGIVADVDGGIPCRRDDHADRDADHWTDLCHGDDATILAAYDIMRSTPEDARDEISDRRIGAVVVCPRQDRVYLAPLPVDSLAHALIDGSPPAWLREVATGDREVRLFVVTP